ncbi:hypothetical protein BBJ28_00023487 [Nothophytophthora sp. Chile5]|nr:hypothetical protein BBJ28_00023487 [Nothophytophthora sp. Chile5]
MYDDTDTQVSLLGNYAHTKSDRSPKVMADNSKDMVHTAENFWDDNANHAFELNSRAYVLAESNYFYDITTSLEDDSGYIYVPTSDQTDFEPYLGRDCVINTLNTSGRLASSSGESALSLATISASKICSSADAGQFTRATAASVSTVSAHSNNCGWGGVDVFLLCNGT